MNEGAKRLIDAAMRTAHDYGEMLRHNQHSLEMASRPGSSVPLRTKTNITEAVIRYGFLYEGALGVLAHILDVAEYDVREPVPFSGGNPLPSPSLAEAELKKWFNENYAEAKK